MLKNPQAPAPPRAKPHPVSTPSNTAPTPEPASSQEEKADLLNVTAEYHEELRPQGVVETELVNTLVRCHSEKRRVPCSKLR